MIENILFDFDGTIVESGLGITNSVAYALQQMGIAPPPLKELEKFIGPPLNKGFEQFYRITGEDNKAAVKHFRTYYNEKGIHENTLYPNIVEVLQTLQNKGYSLYIATSKPLAAAKAIMEDFNLLPYFTDIVGSPMEHTGIAKDEIIKTVLENNHLSPANTIMVGDRHHDIHGGNKNNLATIGVLYGYGNQEELINAGATYIANTPLHLLEIFSSLT